MRGRNDDSKILNYSERESSTGPVSGPIDGAAQEPFFSLGSKKPRDQIVPRAGLRNQDARWHQTHLG